MPANNRDFTVSFWIKVNNNPKWSDIDSKIYFNPITTDSGARVFFLKIGREFRAYILSPEDGHKKLKCDITSTLNSNTFVVVTNGNGISTLYINAEKKDEKRTATKLSEIEDEDLVMVNVKNGELKNLSFGGIDEVTIIGRVISSRTETVKIDLFEIREIGEFRKERLIGVEK